MHQNPGLIGHIKIMHEYCKMIQGVSKKMRHIVSFISPSVLMLQFYALDGQLKVVLPFVLHIGRGLRDKWFPRYSGSGFDYQIQWFTIDSSYTSNTNLFV